MKDLDGSFADESCEEELLEEEEEGGTCSPRDRSRSPEPLFAVGAAEHDLQHGWGYFVISHSFLS